jgi:hypothetical protein
MFESALVEHKVGKEEYELAEPELRTRLIEAQLALLERRPFGMIVLVSGMDSGNRGDARLGMARSAAFADRRLWRSTRRRARPAMWRYWRDLPARGEIMGDVGSRQRAPRDRLPGQTGRNRFERQPPRSTVPRKCLQRRHRAAQVSARPVRRGAEAPTKGTGKADGRGSWSSRNGPMSPIGTKREPLSGGRPADQLGHSP